jgi:hypothetical protein
MTVHRLLLEEVCKLANYLGNKQKAPRSSWMHGTLDDPGLSTLIQTFAAQKDYMLASHSEVPRRPFIDSMTTDNNDLDTELYHLQVVKAQVQD